MVSNRLPSTFFLNGDVIEMVSSVGGLATGVGSVFPYSNKDVWLGWPGYIARSEQEKNIIDNFCNQRQYHPIYLTDSQIRNYYEGFCNRSIWPAFHGFNKYVEDKKAWWSSYKAVNKKFCDAIAPIAKKECTIWINDFHLMLLPQLLRSKNINSKIGFFLHTPFPNESTFQNLPHNREILESLLCADSIGFYLETYRTNFKRVVKRLLPHVVCDGNTIGFSKVGIFPIGIDFKKYSELAKKPDIRKMSKKLRKSLGSDVVYLSIDRLDYTKGIPEKLIAFESLLTRRLCGERRVSLFLVVVPSRENIPENKLLKSRIEQIVQRINETQSKGDWNPIIYHYNSFSTEKLSEFYSMADILVVTSRIDGMNLVCKEFLASKNDCEGVLILSRKAGAYEALRESIVVDPDNINSIVRGLVKALKILNKNAAVMIRLRNEVKINDVTRWGKKFTQFID